VAPFQNIGDILEGIAGKGEKSVVAHI
jgi:hypothetical protein